MKEIILGTLTIVLGVLIALFLYNFVQKSDAPLSGAFPNQANQSRITATSTQYALTSLATGGSSSRLVASSTGTGGRTALSLQAINCAAGGYVRLGFSDTVPATTTGYLLTASTTLNLADEVPMLNGSIRAVAASANCEVNVIEYRSDF